jgi:hypothetical protein
VPGTSGTHDLVRATVSAWVHGHMETYVEDLQLDSLEKCVLSLAQAVYRRYMSTYYRNGGVGSCSGDGDYQPLVLPPEAVTLPAGAIPNALQLQTALVLDNWGATPEPRDPAAHARWVARRTQEANRRLRAATRDWQAYRAAYDYDESLRVAASYQRRPASFSVVKPSANDRSMAPGVPVTNSFQGEGMYFLYTCVCVFGCLCLLYVYIHIRMDEDVYVYVYTFIHTYFMHACMYVLCIYIYISEQPTQRKPSIAGTAGCTRERSGRGWGGSTLLCGGTTRMTAAA